MSQFLAACPAELAPVAIIDPRGSGTTPWQTLLRLPAALLRMQRLLLSGAIDVVHINISVKASTYRKLAVMRLVRRRGVPVVLHLHAGTFPAFFEAVGPRRQSMIRSAFFGAETVVVLGDVWRRYVNEDLGVRSDRISVLPNAVAGPHHLEVSARPPSEPLRIAFIGRLGPAKGVGTLLAALAMLPPGRWSATIAGDGDVARFRQMAHDMGLTNVEFPGWLEAHETRSLLEASHVHVLPSAAEGLPMSVLEAMAMGATNVVTPVGAVPEVVRDRVDGLIVPVGQVDALGDCLTELLEDDELRVRLANEARQVWVRQYSIGPYVERLTNIWGAAANEGRRRRRGNELGAAKQEMNRVVAHFEGASDRYQQVADARPEFRERFLLFESLLDAVERRRIGDKALDLGCGAGHLSIALATRGYKTVAIDGSTAMVHETKSRAARSGRSIEVRQTLLPFSTPDVMSLTGQSLIVMSSVIEYIEDDHEMLRQCRDLLSPGGFLLASFPNSRSVYWLAQHGIGRQGGTRDAAFQAHRYSARQLNQLAPAMGFALEELIYFSLPLQRLLPPSIKARPPRLATMMAAVLRAV